jgi:hypothetical protein
MAKFKFESVKFEQIMKDYAEIREVTIPDAVSVSARLLCVELARRTQPFGDDNKARETGEKAITGDLIGRKRRVGIFGAIGPAMTEAGGYSWYKTGDNVRLFVGKDGFAYGTEKTMFRPDASGSEMRAFHKKNFVNGKASSAGSYTRNIGRWKFLDKMFVSKETLDDYIKSTIKKVGIAKAGWANCALQLKKVNKGKLTADIPPWVIRHTADFKNGKTEDLTSDPQNPRVIMTNTTPWASSVITESEKHTAIGFVTSKMKKQIEYALKKRQKTLIET